MEGAISMRGCIRRLGDISVSGTLLARGCTSAAPGRASRCNGGFVGAR